MGGSRSEPRNENAKIQKTSAKFVILNYFLLVLFSQLLFKAKNPTSTSEKVVRTMSRDPPEERLPEEKKTWFDYVRRFMSENIIKPVHWDIQSEV